MHALYAAPHTPTLWTVKNTVYAAKSDIWQDMWTVLIISNNYNNNNKKNNYPNFSNMGGSMPCLDPFAILHGKVKFRTYIIEEGNWKNGSR